ncbi:MAG: CHAT domain-containing protein, partial [Bacteroidota bacterium]|nr:CHAT domain-containing protein [Bacteroidota bacterium]MDX5430749.1 CHAT domain-containing protein [Bacteroidota bacterium]MDX5469494.1 CHAT domain-containing protein [Bacteroidota bacterium]
NNPTHADGVITALEIAHCDFQKVKLLILSACETAKGENLGNEGLYGLSRAFKLAGAHYMIVSLWPVDDQSTVHFMQRFYWHLQSCGHIEQAFHRTQRELLKSQQEADWAPFILIH